MKDERYGGRLGVTVQAAFADGGSGNAREGRGSMTMASVSAIEV